MYGIFKGGINKPFLQLFLKHRMLLLIFSGATLPTDLTIRNRQRSLKTKTSHMQTIAPEPAAINIGGNTGTKQSGEAPAMAHPVGLPESLSTLAIKCNIFWLAW